MDLAYFAHMYDAFNRRDIDGALAFMTDSVDWPKASEGGRVIGKDEIRAYWTRQWEEFDPHVEPVATAQLEDGSIAVTVHQVVHTRAGKPLFDGNVLHVYKLEGDLIARMDVRDDPGAFQHNASA